MKISVIIPVFGVEKWVVGMLESVLQQSYTDYECVLVNDCTKDSSMELVREVLKSKDEYVRLRVKIVEMEQNSGPSAARNRGLSVAQGEWVFFLDSDDKFVDSNSLAYLIKAAQEFEPDLVQGNFLRVSAVRSFSTSYFNVAEPLFDRQRIVSNFAKLNFTNATNKLIRKAFIDANNLIFEPGILYEDSMWSIRLYGCVTKIATIKENTYYHNIRESSIMTSSFSELKVESLMFISTRTQSLNPDTNIKQLVAFNTLYLLKNVWLTAQFTKQYRMSVLTRLEDERIFKLPVKRDSLPHFSRMLSFVFSIKSRFLRKVWIESLMCCYKLFIRLC